MIEPLMTAEQIASTFGFDRPGWVLECANPKKNADPLPSYRFGEPGERGPVRFRASEVEAWLQRRSTRASENGT
jgi:predicted DNA-binding transcriptional regulator AlpA